MAEARPVRLAIAEGQPFAFLVLFDRRELPAATEADAASWLGDAITRARDAQERGVKADTPLNTGEATLLLLGRGCTWHPHDLQAVEWNARRRITDAADDAARQATAHAEAKWPKLKRAAELDTLFALYTRELERRASVLILGPWLWATVRRWWRQRKWVRR